MSVDTVYQTVEFDVISLNDPDLEETLVLWTDSEDILDAFPQAELNQMREDNAFLILNKSAGTLGVLHPATLALSFEEYHPSEGFNEMRKTAIEKILDGVNAIDAEDKSDEFVEGMNAVLTIITDLQTEGAKKL